MNLFPYYVLFLEKVADVFATSLSTVVDRIELLDLEDSPLIYP